MSADAALVGTSTFVVKAYREPDNTNRFREPAALASLAGVPVVPRLQATVDDPPVVVMADLGPGPSLDDLVARRGPGVQLSGVPRPPSLSPLPPGQCDLSRRATQDHSSSTAPS